MIYTNTVHCIHITYVYNETLFNVLNEDAFLRSRCAAIMFNSFVTDTRNEAAQIQYVRIERILKS